MRSTVQFAAGLALCLLLVTASILPAVAQPGSICGWLDLVPLPAGGQVDTDYLLTIWGTGEVLHLRPPLYAYDNPPEQRWAEQLNAVSEPGFYRIDNPALASGWVTLFDLIARVETCEPAAPTAAAVPTPTSSPLPAAPRLVITALQIEPSQVSVYEPLQIRLLIENHGAALKLPYWEYSGDIYLENSNGGILDRFSFSRGDASSLSPLIEAGMVTLDKWELTIRGRFTSAVEQGNLRVKIEPKNMSGLETEGAISIQPGVGGLSCVAVLVSKLGAPFAPEIGKDSLDLLTSELQSLGCADGDFACQAPPLVKGLVKILLRWFSDAGKIPGVKVAQGIWGVFDTQSLSSCRDPFAYLRQLVLEFNRHGVALSLAGIHSPALIRVTNAAGQRAGFLTNNELLLEIPGSQVFDWLGDRYVLFPADGAATISILGSGEGSAEISLIDGASGREIGYSAISVIEGSTAEVNLSDPELFLVLDFDGDRQVDEILTPSTLVDLHSPTSGALDSPPQPTPGLCGAIFGMAIMPSLALAARKRD